MGKIILLNTPIGNLGDLTPRVLEAFRVGTFFAVEDTRVFKELLNHLGISLEGKRIYSFHDQSEQLILEKLIENAQREDIYVASEAGSPIVSDPAYPLVQRAYAEGIAVDSFSGISAPIMALELAGLPPIPFTFHGFLPRESNKKHRLFQELGQGTHIYFEAPTRIEDTLEVLSEALPDGEVAVLRELSKKFQQVLRFQAREWGERKNELTVKGEFVLIVHQKERQATTSPLKEMASSILEKGANPKAVAKLLGEILDLPAKEIYARLNRQNKTDD